MNKPLPGTPLPPVARAISVLYWAVCSAFFVFLVLLALRSFTATRSDDISFLYYLAWLMNEQGAAPYRDLFDTSFPGTFLLHAVLTGLFGYGDTGFHAANITFFMALAGATWFLLRRIHTRVAAAAILYFGIYYFTSKTSMFLQRDYLALLPAVLALLLAQREQLSPRWRAACIGFLFALAASIKPHFAIGLPVVLLLSGRRVMESIMFAAAGFLLWIIVCALWLWHLDALGSFIDMVTHYLPLYMSLDEQQNPSSYIERLPWMFDEYFSSVSTILIFAGLAAMWAFVAQKTYQQRALIITLAVLAPLYVVYVVIGGRSWDYHWMPFMYFVLSCVALLAAPVNSSDWRWQLLSLLPLALLLNGFIYLATRSDTHNDILNWKNQKPVFVQTDAATQDLQQWMQANIQPDDRVQMMVTGTSGPIFPGLLDLKIKPAGRVQIHLFFYRFTDSEYIEALRFSYLEQLKNYKPRFILDNTHSMYLMAGKINPYSFEKYKQFIADHYNLVYSNANLEPLPEKQILIYENRF